MKFNVSRRALRTPIACGAALFFAWACSSSSDDANLFGGGNGGDGGKLGDGGVIKFESGNGDASSPFKGCKADSDCVSGEICAKNLCKKTEGACSSDDQCKGDTFCCGSGCTNGKASCVVYDPEGGDNRTVQNPLCQQKVEIGTFAPAVQCEWTGPPADDLFGGHVNVLNTILVGDTPLDSGAAGEIIFTAYNGTDGRWEAGAGTDPTFYGVIRIISGQDCKQLDTLDGGPGSLILGAAAPAFADLDGDGAVEIVAAKEGSGVVAFKYDAATGHYKKWWATDDASGYIGYPYPQTYRYSGPAIHDLDNDGFAEVLHLGTVFDGRTGKVRNPGQGNITAMPGATASVGQNNGPIVGDLDVDGIPELVGGSGIYEWSKTQNKWVSKSSAPPNVVCSQTAYADFGTPVAQGNFDFTKKDGIAEVVCGWVDPTDSRSVHGRVKLYTLAKGSIPAQEVFDIDAVYAGGGPITIADYDNDGLPEIGMAFEQAIQVFDVDCKQGTEAGCSGKPYVRWSTKSQDKSSNITGSSVFDFEGDGQAEVVYGDECYVRAYDGKTGDVLYSSYRSSCTWTEYPTIADPDRDGNTEIVVGSNVNCPTTAQCKELIDPVHKGIRCKTNDECFSNSCDQGFCRCQTDSQCAPANSSDRFACADALPGTPGNGKVCRASHPDGNSERFSGVRVLKDTLDRWVSSRPIWNQHAYNITNINDDGSVPRTSDWVQNQNFSQSGKAFNSYRQNVQGATGLGALPDMTGNIDQQTVCRPEGSGIRLTATVCNRGQKGVGAAMPATFYKGSPGEGNILCKTVTNGPVPVGGCLNVECVTNEAYVGTITMRVNDDGTNNQGRTAQECFANNNDDTVTITVCEGPH